MIRDVTFIAKMTAILFAVLVLGCGHQAKQGELLHDQTHEFEIYWPPVAPKSERSPKRRPLLRGYVSIQESIIADETCVLDISVTITRPSTEGHRQYWNSQLSFADLPWMDEVRVWDLASKWQWPNLPFLLRRHGEERVERYGGIDPSKRVDNDFAAVLIRQYDATEDVESLVTRDSPFVSAQWHGNNQQETDIHSVVHTARSDTFRIHIAKNADRSVGKLKLWLIYADFLGSRPPKSWPKDREWSGGILTHCEINWKKLPDLPSRGTVQFLTPSTSTGFDWKNWSEDLSSPAKSRLSASPN